MTVGEELRAALTRHYLGLLPDGLYPAEGGKADQIVKMVAGMSASEIEVAAGLILDWLPQTASEAALGVIGESRGLSRFPGEPLEIWRQRVVGAYAFWELAGTLPGMQLALQQAGYRCTIVEHFRDPDPARWAEFSLAISPANPLPNNAKWGDGQTRWGDGKRWGVNPNAVPTEYLTDLVREIKPAHARLRTLLYFPRGRFWGGQISWGEGRATPVAPLGWGLDFGLPDYPETGSDSGPRWGAEQGIVLYQMEGFNA